MRAVLAALLLAACGGSHAPALPRSGDLYFGYYAGCDTCPPEVADHVTVYMTPPWERLETLSAQLALAQQNGEKVILGFTGAYDPNAEASLAMAWNAIRAQNLADTVIALYPLDEPDVAGRGDAEVRAVNAMLRRVFPGLPLAVIYGTTGQFPGLDSYDWVGRDRYALDSADGCQEATGSGYDEMKGLVQPPQRIILVPGGANPWRQDPACFQQKALEDGQVIAVLAFIWIDVSGNAGIRSNGMKPAYCRMGRTLAGKDTALCG